MKQIVIFFMLVTLNFQVHSANAWYGGELERVWKVNEAQFVVTVSSAALDDCEHKYALFMLNELGQEHFNALYSMALTAFVSGQKVRMVIDKELHGDACHVKSMDMRK